MSTNAVRGQASPARRHRVVTELRARGYAVLPAPREVALGEGTVRLDAGWGLALAGVEATDIAVRTLVSRLDADHGLRLEARPNAPKTVRLAVRQGTVKTGFADERDAQAYGLQISEKEIGVTGNGRPGLFYGVQTLLQLLDGDGQRALTAPTGAIRDWPEYQLRITHWDTKHHQDRPETLKRFLDWSARFKLNGVAFELEDKFEYPSHPVIGAPGAFTTEELQDLVDYALERHIQLIPDVQAPAHLCYALKHEEFAHLRCDGSNYQICLDDPEARQLLFQMYDDVCRATKGVNYFLVSTDEVYYAGICERYRKPYNPVNRSLTWVDYVNAAHAHLSAKGRRIIVWVEYPVLTEHVPLLPPDLINGIMGRDEEKIRAEDRRGIRQLAYVPIQGAEHYFPHYFDYEEGGSLRAGRLRNVFELTQRREATCGNPIGTFAAAWDDCGLHNETFWLGWAAMAQGGWTPGAAPLEQTAADFMDLYYGREVTGMVEVYRALQAGAEFWGSAWERVPSKVRGPGYGYSDAKTPVIRRDRTLFPPALPGPEDLSLEPAFRTRYGPLLDQAPAQLRENDLLLARLQANIARAARNRYNLEVFLSLAYFQRHFVELLLGLAEAEGLLGRAAEAHKENQPKRAVGLLVQAHKQVDRLVDDLYRTYEALKGVWEKSRFPKGRSVAGRHFVHIMDDVKDHPADRRPDLTYLIAPEESIGLPAWRDALAQRIQAYAERQGLPLAPLGEKRLED